MSGTLGRLIAPGTLIGARFRVTRMLGRGGMGAVYEAADERLARRVAIKTLLPELAHDPVLLLRFRTEAETSASLGHPNIVQVIDFQTPPGEPPLLVMELLEGVTMREVLDREGKLAPARATFVAMQMLSALAAAHKAGVVHRDVKPGNVFLLSTLAVRDHVKLVDFGLAKLVADAARAVPALTNLGQVLGTVAYMAPEQASGAAVDHRADLYAVGATLFHALSGLRPFDVVELGKGPTTIASVAPWIDRGLAAAVDRAIARRPEDRFPSAEAMAAALAPFADRERTSTGSPPVASHTTRGAQDFATTRGSAPSHGSSQTPPSYLSSPGTAYGSTQVRSAGPTPPPFAPPSSGSHRLLTTIAIAVAVLTIVPFVLTYGYGALVQWRASTGYYERGAKLEAEKRFLETGPLKPCPAPDRCTETHEDHGVAFPMCTSLAPKLTPLATGEIVLVKKDGGSRLAMVRAPPSGGNVSVQWMMDVGEDVVDDAHVVGRVCSRTAKRPVY